MVVQVLSQLPISCRLSLNCLMSPYFIQAQEEQSAGKEDSILTGGRADRKRELGSCFTVMPLATLGYCPHLVWSLERQVGC